MHKDLVESIPFFQEKPKNFIAFIGPLFKQIHVAKNEYVYIVGDPADEGDFEMFSFRKYF